MEEAQTAVNPQRRYYLDLLRVFLILVVFFAHCAMPFVAEDRWHIVNAETSFAAVAIVGFCYQWGLQLFFLVCGASTGFSLRHRNAGQYVRERFFRLAVPYVAGLAVLVPFQLYFQFSQEGKFNGSMLRFYYWFYSNLHVGWTLKINFDTLHFWFLRDLFEFSLIALPLFLLFKSERGQRMLGACANLMEKRWTLLLMVVPIAVAQMALRVTFPTPEGWSNYVCWLIFFIYGYLLTPDRRIEKAIARCTLPVLVLGVACFSAMGALYAMGYSEAWERHPSYTLGCLLYQVLVSLNTCCWVLFFLGMGVRLLDFRHRISQAAAGLVMPFYILHQVTIITVAFFVVQMKAGIGTKYLLISVPSMIITVLMCEFLVCRFSVLRLFFGMSARLRRSRPKPAIPAVAMEQE